MKRIILLAALPSVAVVLGLITWSQFGNGWTSSAEQTAGAETAELQETFAHNSPATVVTPAADDGHDGGPRLDDVLSPGSLDTPLASNPLRGRAESEAIDLNEPKVTAPRVTVHPAAYQVAVDDDPDHAEDARERRYAQAVRPQEPAPAAEVTPEPAPAAANPFNEDDFSATASQPHGSQPRSRPSLRLKLPRRAAPLRQSLLLAVTAWMISPGARPRRWMKICCHPQEPRHVR